MPHVKMRLKRGAFFYLCDYQPVTKKMPKNIVEHLLNSKILCTFATHFPLIGNGCTFARRPRAILP